MTLQSLIRRFLPSTEPNQEQGEEIPVMPSAPSTRVVIGLGNPGKQYAETRHNLGFFVVDELARRVSAPGSRKRLKADISEAQRNGSKLVLAMPQTFMNDSGIAVREIRSWYKVDLDQILIVVDDLDLPFGTIRLRARGSAGGHNGLSSIFSTLGSQEIARLRVGIGRGTHAARAHVLSRFTPDEQSMLRDVVDRASDIAECWMDDGVLEAMNVTNAPVSDIASSTISNPM